MTRRTWRTALAALGASCALPLVPAPSAEAAVVTLPTGVLSVTAPLAATLSTNGSTISGSLGTTTVVDGRIGSTGYTVSVSTAGFDLVGPAVSSDPVTHIPTSAASVQVTATTGGTASTSSPVALPSALPVFTFTYGGAVATVNLLSTYTLSMSIAVPPAAGQGRYTGTVTQTVV